MLYILGVLLAFIFLGLGLLHIHWALGGKLASDSVLPSVDGKAVFNPTPTITFLVALALFAAAFVITGQLGFWDSIIPQRFFYWGTLVISWAFLLRAVGEFRLVGFFKKVHNTRFAYWDTRLFSPLCLFISIISFLLISLGH